MFSHPSATPAIQSERQESYFASSASMTSVAAAAHQSRRTSFIKMWSVWRILNGSLPCFCRARDSQEHGAQRHGADFDRADAGEGRTNLGVGALRVVVRVREAYDDAGMFDAEPMRR